MKQVGSNTPLHSQYWHDPGSSASKVERAMGQHANRSSSLAFVRQHLKYRHLRGRRLLGRHGQQRSQRPSYPCEMRSPRTWRVSGKGGHWRYSSGDSSERYIRHPVKGPWESLGHRASDIWVTGCKKWVR